MRILMIPSWFPTAAAPFNGSFFLEQARMLADEPDVEVAVVAPRLVPAQKWRGRREVRAEQGITIVDVDVPQFPRPLQAGELSAVAAVAMGAVHALGDAPFDVIHAHSVQPGAVMAKELSLRLGIPYVVTEHRPSSLDELAGRARGLAIGQAVKDASAVMTVSTPFSEALGEHYGVADALVADLPVPDAFFDVPVEADRTGPYVFCHVSHPDENKRVELTIQAFARAARTVDARLVIAGGEPARVAELRAEAQRCGVADRVDLRGLVPRDEMPRLLAEADCFVLASAVEAGGTVLSEAKSAGLAVIATRSWAGRHAVGPQDGLLVDVDDLDGLAAAMTELARAGAARSSTDRAERRERARARYSRRAFVDQQLAVYRAAAADRGVMAFHAPYRIDRFPKGASRLRPKKMLESFRENGWRVHHITGTPAERAAGYRDLRVRTRHGQAPAFLYSENSTQPNLLAMSVRDGLAPLLEARILAFARRTQIPSGEFYRDIYWRYSTKGAKDARSLAMKLLYRVDLAVLHATKTWMFLPSEAMAPVVPCPADRSSALPPGSEIRESRTPEGLHLFYVGGLGADYGLHQCVEAVAATEGVTLTMCVPPAQWEKHRGEYEHLLSDRITVVHAGPHELGEHYDRASACVLFVEPTEYRTFAAPVKFYEYLGAGKPILLSEGTRAGDVGEDLGIGVAVPYTAEDFAALLRRLVDEPAELERLAARAREVRHAQTWRARADVAARTLLERGTPALRRAARAALTR